MSSVTLLGDTSGSVILAAPAIAGSSTVTLPTTGGTIRTTTTSGTVLQIVQFSTSNTVTMSSGGSFASLGWSVSITPSSASNKVLLMGACCVYVNGSTGEPHMTIYRGGTNIGGGSGFTDQYSNGGSLVTNHPYIYLDSPSATTSTTYTLYARLDVTGTAYFGANNCTTTLIAMEIAG